jgi:hypothetical protein
MDKKALDEFERRKEIRSLNEKLSRYYKVENGTWKASGLLEEGKHDGDRSTS